MFAGGFGIFGLGCFAPVLACLAMPAGVYLLARGLAPSGRREGPAGAVVGLVLLVWGTTYWFG